MKISKFLWIFPFFSFILGYYILHCFLQKKDLYTPNIIGKSLQASMNALSAESLSVRLLRQQEDPDLPEGIILDQLPRPNQKIKTNQHVFVTISKKPKPVLTPDFIGQNQKTITTSATKMGLYTKIFWLKSNYPINTCIAQSPDPGSHFVSGKLITYLSSGNQTMYVVPSLKNFPILKLKELCNKENIKLDIFHDKKIEDDHNCQDCKVVDQKPMPGSIIDMSKKLYMQVTVV